jgi:DNA-binding response OmpR family regulator
MTDCGRILLADDEETFLHATADLLRREGYACECVGDGESALKKIDAERYDLLIADILMPGNPQLELVRQIGERAPGMPIILVTAYPTLGSAISSVGLSVSSYLIKPVEWDDLKAAVARAIGDRRLYDAVATMSSRLEQWKTGLTDMESLLQRSANGSAESALQAFSELTFLNVMGALTDMHRVARAHAKATESAQVCHLFNCPRLRTLTQALRDAVAVLEHTRQSFKSKELADLRKQLTDVIDRFGLIAPPNDPDGPSPGMPN